jgi:hypothetical protein
MATMAPAPAALLRNGVLGQPVRRVAAAAPRRARRASVLKAVVAAGSEVRRAAAAGCRCGATPPALLGLSIRACGRPAPPLTRTLPRLCVRAASRRHPGAQGAERA